MASDGMENSGNRDSLQAVNASGARIAEHTASLRTRPGDVLFVVCCSLFLMPFMLSAVSVALPRIGHDLGASAVELGLVETVYVMSLTIFLLMMGRIGDIKGRRSVFRWGVGVFTLSTIALALIHSMSVFIGLRIVQGLGAAMVNASGLAMVVSVYPREMRGRALGIGSAVVYAGISCGPALGGFITSLLGWRYIFFMAVPLGVLSWWVALTRLKDEWREAQGERYDLPGSLLYGTGIALLTIGAAWVEQDVRAWWAVVGGLVALACFAVFELRTRFPLLDVRMFGSNSTFALGCLAACINYAATTGMMLYMSFYLQVVQGLAPYDAGLMLALQPLVQMVLSPLGGRLADRYAPASVATSGMACSGVALLLATGLDAESTLFFTAVVQFFMGVGLALFASPNTSSIMGSVPPRYLGIASGMTGTMRTFGMMTSMLVVTITFSLFMDGQPVTGETVPSFLRSMHVDLLFYGVLSLAGTCLSAVRLFRKEPA